MGDDTHADTVINCCLGDIGEICIELSALASAFELTGNGRMAKELHRHAQALSDSVDTIAAAAGTR